MKKLLLLCLPVIVFLVSNVYTALSETNQKSEISKSDSVSSYPPPVIGNKDSTRYHQPGMPYYNAENTPEEKRPATREAESPQTPSASPVKESGQAPDWPEEYKKRAIEAMKSDTFRRHERAKQIMLLFNIEKIDVITNDQLENTRKLLADYDRLKRKK